MNSLPVDEIAELQLRSIRKRHDLLDERAARLFLEERVSRWDPVEFHVTHGPRELRGTIALTGPAPSMWGPDEPRLHIVVDVAPDVVDWASGVLRELAPRLPGSVMARLDADYGALRSTLAELDFGVAKLGLSGTIERALDRLRAHELVEPESLGLRIDRVTTPEDVMATVQLRKTFFTMHPEYGWGTRHPVSAATQKEIDRRIADELEVRRNQGVGTDFIVVDSIGMVVGAFGFQPTANHPIGGSTAGIYICLTEQVQGQGLGRAAYARMLERAAELGIESVRGSTSNPGVIHLAAQQGRHLDNWLMRRDPPFIDQSLWDYPPGGDGDGA